MRISDWSSDVCSSDLVGIAGMAWLLVAVVGLCLLAMLACLRPLSGQAMLPLWMFALIAVAMAMLMATTLVATRPDWSAAARSEEHTSELQSLMRISYAVFCLKKKTGSSIV